MPEPTGRRPRGRPRDPARMARVIETAKQHFNAHGFDRASVDAIAEASGVSKVTIYRYFPTKAELFQAAVSHRVAEDFKGVDWQALDPRTPKDALTRIGRAFLAVVRSGDVLKSHRTLYGAMSTDTQAAERFYAAGPIALAEAVAGYLRAADRAGSLRVRDPQVAADQFLSMFLGLGHIRGLLGLAEPTVEENEQRLKANVDLFLRAHLPPEAAGRGAGSRARGGTAR